MANQQLFQSAERGKTPPKATKHNHAGGTAYEQDARTALAQLAATGCFGNTYYVSGREQLDNVVEYAKEVSPAFVAKVAVYARTRGHMKDMPAVLLAHLTTRGDEGAAALKAAFPQVIDNGRMLRNFVQIIRSGQMGRKSLGTVPKKLVQRWLKGRYPMQLFRDSIGNDPSLVDVIKMVHPRPASDEQRSMYGYLLGKDFDADKLPPTVRHFEAWKRGEAEGSVPKVPFRMLDALSLGEKEWVEIARNARWQETRMNLVNWSKKGVFRDQEMVKLVASRLADEEQVHSAKVFPYQLMQAWKMSSLLPYAIQEALQDAMEHAVANIPEIDGQVIVCPDVSGSMRNAITGHRRGATSAIACVEVAGLITAALARRNKRARVLPFGTRVESIRINPRDSIMTIAERLASIHGGGTNVSAPLAQLNHENAKGDVVIYVSDGESWIDSMGRTRSNWAANPTETMSQWQRFRSRNRNAKMVCIDLTPNTMKQTIEREDILSVGGFSDQVFDVMANFVNGDGSPWADIIDREVSIDISPNGDGPYR